jgi:hypothetical protein
MTHSSWSAFAVSSWSAFAALAATPAVAQTSPCVDCKDETSTTHRDQVKAARAKYDLEMKLDTKRPWDGLDIKTGARKLASPPALVQIPD